MQAYADDKRWRTALAAMTALSRLASEAARMSAPPPAPRGKPAPEPVPVKLADAEEWQDLKRRILRLLDRYPGARKALAQELSDAA